MDIATIAFFADLKNNPSESFIYFEQDKPMHFMPHVVLLNQSDGGCKIIVVFNSL